MNWESWRRFGTWAAAAGSRLGQLRCLVDRRHCGTLSLRQARKVGAVEALQEDHDS